MTKEKKIREKLLRESVRAYASGELPRARKKQTLPIIQATPSEQEPPVSTMCPLWGNGDTAIVIKEAALNMGDGLKIDDWVRKELAGKEVYIIDSTEITKVVGGRKINFQTVLPVDGKVNSMKPIDLPSKWLKKLAAHAR